MAKQAGIYIGKVEGREEAVKILNGLKPTLYNNLVEKVKEEAESVAQAITRAMPNTAPMRGFGNHGGKTAWSERGEAEAKAQHTLVQTGSGTAEWPVYKISMGGYASAVADIAGAGGKGNSLQGQQMIEVLNSRVGRASRWVWPVAKRHEGLVVRKMEQACEKVEDEMSRRLAANAPAGAAV